MRLHRHADSQAQVPEAAAAKHPRSELVNTLFPRLAPVVGAVSMLALTVMPLGCTPADDDAGSSGTGGKAAPAGTGGTAPVATGTGGASGTGGSGSGGGVVGSGGAPGTGGAPSATGGAVGSGGAPSVGGNGGTTSTGGRTGNGGNGPGTGGAAGMSGGGAGQSGGNLPDPGSEGDGDFTVGPNYTAQADLSDRGNPKGRSFTYNITSKIFDGKDPTLTLTPVNVTRQIRAYIPAMYKDGTPAPVIVLQDGPSDFSQVSNAVDNLSISQDPMRKLPAFIVISVPAGGSDAIGSERGLEYDTLSDRYARYITEEVMPGLQTAAKATYPNLKFDPSGSGRAALGCSSGGAAALTMAWFRPDLFSRVVAYSATLVAQQDPKAPESAKYPHGAWDYHSDLELIKNDTTGLEKKIRVFHHVNENDLMSTAPDSGRHNWVSANKKTAAALKAKGFHYRFVYGLGKGHCDAQVKNATMADALIWVWRGYQPAAN